MSAWKTVLARHWESEKPDGRPAWGALKYLLFGGLLCGALLWVAHRMMLSTASSGSGNFIGAAKRPANPAANQVHLKEIAKSAQETRPIELQYKPEAEISASQVGIDLGSSSNGKDALPSRAKSQPSGGEAGRDMVDDRPPPGEGDSIFTALARSQEQPQADGRPILDEKAKVGGSPASAKSKDLRAGNPVSTSGTAAPSRDLPAIESLLAKNIRSPGKAPAGSEAQPDILRSTHWLPRGEIIPVFLMQNVETGKFPTLIEFAVAKTVWFNGNPVLLFGTRFTGTAGLGVRDRIIFNVDSLRRRDGLSLAVAGTVLGTDQATGLQAYYIPPPTLAQLTPYVGSFLESFADLIKTRAGTSTLSVGGVGVSVNQQSLSDSTREAAVYGASKALGDFLGAQLADIRERYQAYLTIPAGSSAFVQLTANVDLTALWDSAPRGRARTIGSPKVISTEDVYARRDAERAQPSIAALLGQHSAAPAAQASELVPSALARPPLNPPSAAPVTTGAGTGNSTIRDPLAQH